MKNKIRYIALLFISLILLTPFTFIIISYIDSYNLLKNGIEFKPALSTKIFDSNGILISELFEENRSYISIKDIPQNIKIAFISAEDQNFYKHRGIDFRGIIRAIIVDVFSGSIKQGGSSITQQLVKQLYTKREKTIKRKVIELIIANIFESKFSKDKILEMYLNQIYFGHGVYGVKSAAKFYFNKDIEKLSIIESSLLAGIPSAPNRYSPLKNPRLSFNKNIKVLHEIISSGYISKVEASKKFNIFWENYLSEIKTRYATLGVRNKKMDKAPYFTEYIRRRLLDKNSEDTVYRGGLKVYTTLNLGYQDIARKSLKDSIVLQNKLAESYFGDRSSRIDYLLSERNKKLSKVEKVANIKYLKYNRKNIELNLDMVSLFFGLDNVNKLVEKNIETYQKMLISSKVEGGIIAIDPKNGYIVSMVGGSEFNEKNQLNRSVQSLRQPGSAFKAYIYGAGIESREITASTLFNDLPLYFKGRTRKKDWKPSNYGKQYRGKVLTRTGFALSLNIVSVLIYNRIGGLKIAKFASRLVSIPLNRFQIDPTLALGTSEVSLLEMTRGFSVIANNGIQVAPISIRYIINREGKKIYDGEAINRKNREQIISRETSFILTSIMRSVVDYGTASYALRRVVGFKLPAAGKTGTNTSFRDAWFCGFTPDLVATVWIGCDSQKFTLRPGQSGAYAAAPVWANYMKNIYKTRKRGYFSKPPKGVSIRSVCSVNGSILGRTCRRRKEYFISGTEPKTRCKGNHSGFSGFFNKANQKKKEKNDNFLNKFGSESWREKDESEDLDDKENINNNENFDNNLKKLER
jgi:penicillin-binding protein 1A